MTQTLLAPPRSRDIALSGPADILARRLGSSAKTVLHQAKLASLSADFAQTLNASRARSEQAGQAGKVDGKNDPRPDRADDDARTEDARSNNADEAQEAEENPDSEAKEQTSDLAANAASEESLESIGGPQTQGTDVEVPDAELSQAGSVAGNSESGPVLKPEQFVNQRPVTIDVLNVMLLQGNASPKFALVAPQSRPGAALTKAASESATPAKSPATDRSDLGVDPAARAATFQPTAENSGTTRKEATSATSSPSQTLERKAESSAPRANSANASTPDARTPEQSVAPSPSNVPADTLRTPGLNVPPAEFRTRADAPNRAVAGIDSASAKLLDRLAGDRAKNTHEAAPSEKTAQFQRALDAQLQRGVAQALQTSTGTVTLRLQPANLGQLKVQVKLEGQTIRAKFEVASTKTREMLRESIDHLRTSLGEKGLKLEDVAVTVAPRLPERDLGLPPVHGQSHDTAGAQFASTQTSAGDADMGGAHQPPQGGSQQPAEPGAAEWTFVDEQPVSLVGESVLTIGHDGRVRVDATA